MRIFSASGLPVRGNQVNGDSQSFIHCSGTNLDIYYATPIINNCTALSAVTPVGSGIRANVLITPNYSTILNDVSVLVTATPVGIPEYWITLGVYANVDYQDKNIEDERVVLYPGTLLAQSFEIPVTTSGKISWRPMLKLERNKAYWLAYLPSRSALSVRGSTAGGSAGCGNLYGNGNSLGTAATWGIAVTIAAANALVRATGLPDQFPAGGAAQTSAQPIIFYRPMYGGP